MVQIWGGENWFKNLEFSLWVALIYVQFGRDGSEMLQK